MRPRKEIPREVLEEAEKSGKPDRVLAKELGVDRETIKRRRKRFGMGPRRRGPKVNPIMNEVRERLFRGEDGDYPAQVARDTGVDRGWVNKTAIKLREGGYRTRRGWGRNRKGQDKTK